MVLHSENGRVDPKTQSRTVLSVLNRWSVLICRGLKDVENHSWPTDFRGRLYVHSSGRPMAFPEARDAIGGPPFVLFPSYEHGFRLASSMTTPLLGLQDARPPQAGDDHRGI